MVTGRYRTGKSEIRGRPRAVVRKRTVNELTCASFYYGIYAKSRPLRSPCLKRPPSAVGGESGEDDTPCGDPLDRRIAGRIRHALRPDGRRRNVREVE